MLWLQQNVGLLSVAGFSCIAVIGVLASLSIENPSFDIALEDIAENGWHSQLEPGSRWLPHGDGEHPEFLGMSTDSRQLRDKSCDFRPTLNSDACELSNCTYCPFERCWARPNALFDDEGSCDSEFPEASTCPDLRYPNPIVCPGDVGIDWDTPIEAQIQQGKPFVLRSSLDLGDLKPVYSPCATHEGIGIINHANAHGCIRSQATWWCHELVPAYQPASAVTNSPAQCLNSTDSTIFNMTLPSGSRKQPNEWVVYVHYRFFTEEENGNLTKWHVTKGSTFLVLGERLGAREDVEIMMTTLAGFVLVFPTLVFAVLIFWLRKHWVMVASSWIMCELIIFGGFLGGVSIYAFIPGNLSIGGTEAIERGDNDRFCLMRQWLVPLAFDFIVIPMTLKTWRVYRLFGEQQTARRVTIPNKLLLMSFAAVIAVEILFNAIWSSLDSTALHVERRFTDLNPNVFELECKSKDQTAQVVLTVISILMHLIPCLILTFYAYKIRLSFSFQKVNEKYDVFDESLFIMLALLDLTVVGLFVIIFQAVIDSNPNAITVMRSCGIAWIVAFTLLIMFVPKFIRIRNWDAEREAAERRQSTGFGSQASHTRGRLSDSYSGGNRRQSIPRSSFPAAQAAPPQGGAPSSKPNQLNGGKEEFQRMPDPIMPTIRAVVVEEVDMDSVEGEAHTIQELTSDSEDEEVVAHVSSPSARQKKTLALT